MMDCAAYRRAVLAEPDADRPELRRHVASCDGCAAYTRRLQSFESRLSSALRVAAPGVAESAPRGEAVVIPLKRARKGHNKVPVGVRRRLAVAASLLLGGVIALGLWIAAPGRSLAAAVVGHMAEEPEAWARTAVPVTGPALKEVLAASHLGLKSDAGLVSYAHSCLFRGHLVPHLVVQTGTGPVTVMVLTHESVKAAVRFDEQGYEGVIVPAGRHGSIAVLERGAKTGNASLAALAARVDHALD